MNLPDCYRQSGRLWSLLDMLSEKSGDFLKVVVLYEHMLKKINHAWVGSFINRAPQFRPAVINRIPDADEIEVFEDDLSEIARLCARLGATASEDNAKARMEELRSGISMESIEILLQDSARTFYDEFNEWRFLVLPGSRRFKGTAADLYENGHNNELFFGSECDVVLADAIDDMDDAVKCYALEQWTACTFHCMGVVEVGIRAVCQKLPTTIDLMAPDCTWNKMIDAINGMILPRGSVASIRKTAHPATWPQDEQVFSECVSDIRAISRAYRNPTMHFKTIRRADGDQAKKVLGRASEFAQHLSEHLPTIP